MFRLVKSLSASISVCHPQLFLSVIPAINDKYSPSFVEEPPNPDYVFGQVFFLSEKFSNITKCKCINSFEPPPLKS